MPCQKRNRCRNNDDVDLRAHHVIPVLGISFSRLRNCVQPTESSAGPKPPLAVHREKNVCRMLLIYDERWEAHNLVVPVFCSSRSVRLKYAFAISYEDL